MAEKIRIAHINMTEKGSTGHIMLQITALANTRDMVAKSFSANLYKSKNKKYAIENHRYYGWNIESTFHTILGKITGYNGSFSCIGTRQLLNWLDEFKPDILHLHNLHQFCINYSMLFKYIKKHNITVVWTLHDCWSFTGHCPHFIIEKCKKWKTECHHCPQYKKYPKTYVDRSKELYKKKKNLFVGVEDMTLVTPSNWLANLVKQSFLANYPIRVINNGIDLSVFHITDSNFRKKYFCEDKKILLGVSFSWSYSKGLDVFIELSRRLDKSYQIVLVGTNDAIDEMLPENIITIHRTDDKEELAGIYSAADLFVNPTREDTYPTVNMEAIACGTPVISFKSCGSPETIPEGCGLVVECNDIDDMEKNIKNLCEDKKISKEILIKKSTTFDMNKCFEEYIKLYRELGRK